MEELGMTRPLTRCHGRLAAARSLVGRRRASLMESLESRILLAADLAGSWVNLNTLPAIISGQALPPVTLHVQNDGDTSSPAGAIAEIYMSSDNTLDVQDDRMVGFIKLPALAAGASKDLILSKIKLPPGVDAGDVFLIARLDPTGKIAEGNENNNDVVSAQPVTVQQPDYDLSGSMAPPKINLNLVQGVAAKGTVALTLANTGDLSIPSTAKINIAFFLRPVDAVDNTGDIAAGTLLNQSGAVAANSTRVVNGKLAISAATPSGQYNLVAIIDTTDALAETNEANNQVVGTQVITLAQPFADLGITASTETAGENIPAGAVALVTLTVSNGGNVAATGTIGVTLVAKAQGQADVTLLTLTNIPFTAKAGFSKTVKASFSVPLVLVDGVLYNIEATITPVTSVGGDVLENNVVTVGNGFIPDIPEVSIPEIGDKLTFSNEVPANGDGVDGHSVKSGNFIDGNGRSGTYLYNHDGNLEVASLSLHWTDGQQPANATYTLLYGNEGGPTTLKNKRLRVFAEVNSEAIGQIAVGFLDYRGYVSVG
jgi:hypothetical protein